MPFDLTTDDVQALLTALCGSYDVIVGSAKVRLLARPLPGGAVCSILPDLGDGILRLVYDVAKPNSFHHVQWMVREWWESIRQPVVFPDGSVELIQLPCPLAGEGPLLIKILD